MVRRVRKASRQGVGVDRRRAWRAHRHRSRRIRHDIVVRPGRTDDPRDANIMKASYSGSVKAVILDWAGTTVDHGSLAPVRVLQQVFAKRGVPISEEEARRDMGVLKIDHIRKIILNENVSTRWRKAAGRDPTETDVEELFANFIPLQLECLVKYSTVIDGVAETVARL